jgi:hypothetical protein
MQAFLIFTSISIALGGMTVAFFNYIDLGSKQMAFWGLVVTVLGLIGLAAAANLM